MEEISNKGKVRLRLAPDIVCAFVLIVSVSAILDAQTVDIHPEELRRAPVTDIGGGRYWQQLAITFDYADAAADSTVTIVLPDGITVYDTDSDGVFADEVRLVYRSFSQESPDFFISGVSKSDTVVISSAAAVAAGGELFVQFPIVSNIGTLNGESVRYGSILFADYREQDISEGPSLKFVEAAEFAALGSMDVIGFQPLLAAGSDTTTASEGTHFPQEDQVLLLSLPDFAVHDGVTTSNNRLGFGDGVVYKFFFSLNPLLTNVDSTTAAIVRTSDGSEYIETEGPAATVRLLTSDLASGTYYLYVTSNVTGGLPLARSRGIGVQHKPHIFRFGTSEQRSITLDSGSLLDLEGLPKGKSQWSTSILFEVVDHDDNVTAHLYYSSASDLNADSVLVDTSLILLNGATALTDSMGILSTSGQFVWNVRDPVTISEGDYYLYLVAIAGSDVVVGRSEDQIYVRHTPFLRIDPTDDRVLSGSDSIFTGGHRPQQFITLTWGRGGHDGDYDLDDNAIIDFYVSTRPAYSLSNFDSTADSENDSILVPGGAQGLMADLNASTRLIAKGLQEDADERSDNQLIWDLWEFSSGSGGVLEEGVVHYIYGLISDGKHDRIVQMNGGRLNDAASRLVFRHHPSIRPLQPMADLRLDAKGSARVSWEDQDLNDDACIRVILSAEDYGAIAIYSNVTSGRAYIVNSEFGRAEREFNADYDIREDSPVDFLDVRTDHLVVSVNDDQPFQSGAYSVYIAIEDDGRFNGETLTYRAQGQLIFSEQMVSDTNASTLKGPIELLPQAFTMGTGGFVQTVEVLVNSGAESIDLVGATFSTDAQLLTVIDQDLSVEGIQPFTVSEGFSAPKLVTNTLVTTEDNRLLLRFEYFDPTAPHLEGMDGEQSLVSFDLVSLESEGNATLDIVPEEVKEFETKTLSRLERNGVVVMVPDALPLAALNLLPGRALVRGQLFLEGRKDMTSLVDISLRPWGSYSDLVDSVFAKANDQDPNHEGVQVAVQGDGAFELIEVPAGRIDLHAHLDGYINGWSPGLDPFPSQEITEVRPTSSGDPDDLLMRGGDVAGYMEIDGSSRPDNEVTLADWDFVAALFDEVIGAESDSARADISGDGQVTVRDLALVGANFLGRGPRPVFKTTATELPEYYEWNQIENFSGERTEISLQIEPSWGFSALQIDLLYDPDEWLLEKTTVSKNALSVQRDYAWGIRLAATTTTGQDFTKRAGDLVTWELRSLVTEPTMPTVTPPTLLDSQHRFLTVREKDRIGMVNAAPTRFTLAQNFPNPFNPETTMAFTVAPFSSVSASEDKSAVTGASSEATVSVDVFNSLGQRVKVLVDGQSLEPGSYRVFWDGRDDQGRLVGSGVYIYRLRNISGQIEIVRRMLLLR